ncbi:MAG: LPS-assembly protein LptD [Pseudomonadota bacterium]
MTDCRRAENTRLLRWQLTPLVAAMLALPAPLVLAAEQPSTEPALVSKPNASLPNIDTAGERLGWMSRAEIAALPAVDRPILDDTCEGGWVTPIGSSVVASRLEETDVQAMADSLTYRDNGEAVMEGQVRLQQPGRLVEADSGSLTQDRDYARFDGNIRLAEPGLLLTGDQGVVNVNSSAGQLLSSEFVSSTMHAHGRAERIRRFSDGSMRIDQGIYTTCAPGQRSWSFQARNIELNPEAGTGKVYGATLRIADIPVLYTPYFRFPIDDRRQTGLLPPHFGTSTNGGFLYAQPIYLNLAENYDATFTPTLYTQRGTLLEGEFRYLSKSLGRGEIRGAILPNDSQTGEDRKSGQVRHALGWGNGWTARTDLNYVSDPFYRSDLGSGLEIANQTYQERVGEVRLDREKWHFLARAQGFQTLDEGLADSDKPYTRLPQLLLSSDPSRLPGWQQQARAEITNFQRTINDNSPLTSEINGVRLRLDPQLRYDYNQSWGFLRPGIKLSHLQYALTGNGTTNKTDSPSFTLPTLSLDSGLYFERLNAGGSSTTLEPRALYLYSPYRDQTALPVFDTATRTFSYDQLFRDTRFSGNDRIDDAHQLSLGVTTRQLDSDGFEHLQASLGQIYYFRDRLVTLPPSCNGTTGCAGGGQPGISASSDFAGNITVRANEEASVYTDFLLSPDDGKFTQYSVGASYLPKNAGRVYNAGYRYRRNDQQIEQKPVSQTQLSFVQPFGANWKAIALWQYDLLAQESQEALFGVSYESCCWQVRVFKRNYIAVTSDVQQPNTDRNSSAFFVEITLKGLAGLGSSVDTLLERNVIGYSQLTKNEDSF